MLLLEKQFMSNNKNTAEIAERHQQLIILAILYSEQTFAQATQIFLSNQDVASATKMVELFTIHYPKSAIGHFFLAVAARAGGNREKAAKAVETAIKLYEADPKPELNSLYANMKQFEAGSTVEKQDEVSSGLELCYLGKITFSGGPETHF